jgi:hypothetical protein
MYHEQQQTVSVGSNDVRERTHVLLVNALCLSCTVLRNWREQRPRNLSDLDFSINVEVERVCCTGMDLLTI